MASNSDKARREAKASAVTARLAEIHDSRDVLIRMLDEHKLDLLILAIGIGAVELTTDLDDEDHPDDDSDLADEDF